MRLLKVALSDEILSQVVFCQLKIDNVLLFLLRKGQGRIPTQGHCATSHRMKSKESLFEEFQ
jgi:hypothetical protein